MALLVPANGSPTSVVLPADGLEFTLEELRGLVGGHIEIGRLRGVPPIAPDLFLVVNEDGHRLELPFNPRATALYRAGGGEGRGPIVGPAVIASLAELGE